MSKQMSIFCMLLCNVINVCLIFLIGFGIINMLLLAAIIPFYCDFLGIDV